MSDLTDFLLARFAEDEDQARKRMHHAQENHLLLQDPKYLGRFVPGWYEWPEIEAAAARVLAECEKNRRIVELAQHAEKRTHDADPMPEGSEWLLGQRWGTGSVLALLASVYADHPDFRSEWESV